MMKKAGWTAGIIILLFSSAFTSCSTVSGPVRRKAVDASFEQLVRDPDRYTGDIVILGGYVREILEVDGDTELIVQQAPLGLFDRPKSIEESGGRFRVVSDEELHPGLFGPGQDITVAGPVLGKDNFLTIKALEIHRWSYGHDGEVEDILEAAEPF